jgi:dual specificity phosphatase 12
VPPTIDEPIAQRLDRRSPHRPLLGSHKTWAEFVFIACHSAVTDFDTRFAAIDHAWNIFIVRLVLVSFKIVTPLLKFMRNVYLNIFLGDTHDAHSFENLTQNSIKTIVNCARNHPSVFETDFAYIYFPLVDDETDNVLLYVDEASQRIASGHNVLVHCVHGVSRSVAIVTAYLMKKEHLGFEEAYARIKSVYPPANIAENFKEQLRLFGGLLLWNVALNTQAHRLYRARARLDMKGSMPFHDGQSPQFRYTCRKCRFSLFLDTQTVQDVKPSCSRIECMEWMMNVDSAVKGPLNCPGCGVKIGHYSWVGVTIGCSDPAFMITDSKVDRMPIHSSFKKGEAFPKTRY